MLQMGRSLLVRNLICVLLIGLFMLKIGVQVSSLANGKTPSAQKICTDPGKADKEEKKNAEKQLENAKYCQNFEKRPIQPFSVCNIKALAKFHQPRYIPEHIGSVDTPPPNLPG